jgi:DNA-directed RNA polymerase specialized sigma24 family protein
MTATDGKPPAVDSAASFYESVWPHAELLLRLATFACDDHALAEELAYQTLLAAAATINQRGEADWRMWLLGILYRQGQSLLSNSATAPADVEAHGLSKAASGSNTPAGDPREILASLSDQQVLMAMRELPPEMRWTVLLLDVAGLNQQQVAVILDRPVWTIESHVKQAREMLRDVLVPLAAEVNSVQRNQVFERR